MGGASAGIASSVGAWASVFNLGNGAIGAGILTFPFAFQCAGLFGGTLICMVVAGIELFTLNVLMRQATKHHAYTYQGLVHKGLGVLPSEIMSWTIFLYLWGSCVAYLIIVGDTFGSVLRAYVIEPNGLPEWLAARQIMIMLPAITIILPLSLQRSMGALAPTSTLAVVVMIMTTLVILSKAFVSAGSWNWQHGLPEGVVLWKLDISMFSAIPVMVFAYHCHVQAVPIFYELVEDPKLFPCIQKRPSGPPPVLTYAQASKRKLLGMSNVLAMAYLECTVMYLAVGMAGYLMFPTATSSNILNEFSERDDLMQFVRVCVGWAVVFHYPINQHVARSAMYDLACRYAGVQQKHHVPYSHVALITLVFFAAATSTACLVTDLGVVFQILGGVAGSLLIFLLPGSLLLLPKTMTTAPLHHSGSYIAVEEHDADHDELEQMEPFLRASAVEAAEQGVASSSTAVPPPSTPARPQRKWHDSRYLGAALLLVGTLVMVMTLYTTLSSPRRPANEHDMSDESSLKTASSDALLSTLLLAA